VGGGVENTLHARAEFKKHQREATIKVTQMGEHVQCTVLAEIPATRSSPDPLQSVTSSTSATTTHSGVVRQPLERRNGGRRAKRQHRALAALAAARTATTSKAAPASPATRGAPGHGCSDAIEAAALAAALAESALVSPYQIRISAGIRI
jgi:hypothetical protein